MKISFMNNKVYSIDVAMLTKKYYCHKCGDRLVKNPRTKTIHRGDPEYQKHSRMGRRFIIGDIKLTEYDFKCDNCANSLTPDEQYVIHTIQKKLKTHVLSKEDCLQNENQARLEITKKKKILDIIVKTISIIVLVVAIYFSIKNS